MPSQPVRRCRSCACTDDDCYRCIERTGQPCSWIEADLCSACEAPCRVVVYRPPDDSPLCSVVLDATGAALDAYNAGQYVTDAGELGDHLVEVLDAVRPGIHEIVGRVRAVVSRLPSEGEVVDYAAEDVWRVVEPIAPPDAALPGWLVGLLDAGRELATIAEDDVQACAAHMPDGDLEACADCRPTREAILRWARAVVRARRGAPKVGGP